MLRRIIDYIDEPIDYVGQKKADDILLWLFTLGYSVALIMGFVLQNLLVTLVLGVLTVVLACILVIPSWSFYKKNKVVFCSEKIKNK